jgi:outer membrane protein insertion porin family
MRIFIVTVLLVVGVYAQVIKSIKFEGLYHLSQTVARDMIALKPGDTFDVSEIDKAIKTYFKLGYFQDIWVNDNEGVITFHFKEKPIISKVTVKGYKEDDKDFLKNTIRIKRGSLYDPKAVERAKKRIIEYLNEKDKIDTVVEVKKKSQKNGSIHLTFVINEGYEIIINKIRYDGLRAFEPSKFDDVVANKQHQFMGWLWGRNSGELKLEQLQYDPLRMKDLYMQHGYLDARVDSPFVRVNFDDYTCNMSYQIHEGKPYSVKSIKVEQTKQIVKNSVLRKAIQMQVGKHFDIKTFREDAKRIKTIIADHGYAFVQVVPDLHKDSKKHTVALTYKVEPGDKVYIHNVIIKGNDKTLDRVIRRELYLGPGDLFSLTDLDDSKNSLGRLGFFSSSTIEQRRLNEHSMDLIVLVKEQPTGSIQLGGGYGSYGGLLLSIAVSERNIWGSGITVGVQLNKSQATHNYSFSISNPRLNDSDYSGNFSVYESGTDYTDYSIESQGLTLGTGHRFTRHISGYLSYGYSNNQYKDVDYQALSLYGSEFYASYDKSSITASVVFNDTDNYYLPRKGMIISQSLEKAGLGANADFIKSQTAFDKYYGLKKYLDIDAIFHYRARFDYALATGYLPMAEKYYLGGIGSVRGYQDYSLSPVVDNNGTEVRVGATKAFSNSVEMSFPLIKKAKMRFVTFVDWGLIGDSSITQISRGGYGIGLDWFSPVGPIQLVFANPLNSKPGDNVSHFEFTMGQRF